MNLQLAFRHLPILLGTIVLTCDISGVHGGTVLSCPPDGVDTVIAVTGGGADTLSLNIKPTS